MFVFSVFFFFQAEDGIRDLVRSRGLGDVYKRQALFSYWAIGFALQFGGIGLIDGRAGFNGLVWEWSVSYTHLTLPTSDLSVDLGGRRIIKKKKTKKTQRRSSK